jgi:outer membrane protein TolC
VDRNVSTVLRDAARFRIEVSTNALADSILLPAPSSASSAPVVLSLSNALHLATLNNRNLQSRRESLYRQTLDLMATRRNFGWSLSGTIGFVLLSNENGSTDTASVDIKAGKPLVTGGTLSASGSAGVKTSQADALSESGTTQADLQARLDQPLLAGAGPGASRETLRQAERNLVDALRTFALDRQDIALDIVGDFYGLLTSRSVVENTRKATEQSVNLRRRTEALFRVRRAPAIDVMRAQQQELASQNQLAQTALDYDLQLRRFRVKLGISESAAGALEGDIPRLQPFPLNAQQCEAAAIEGRPDILAARDRCTDAERHLAVANNGLLPQLDAYAQVNISGASTSALSQIESDTSYGAGLALKIPFDRRDERDQWRLAQLNLAEARRDWESQKDGLRLDILERLSRLRYLKGSAAIEEKNLAIAEKRAQNAQQRFKNGELENRDVVEAENELLSARNALVRATVGYELARLTLLRDSGLLDVTTDGQLIERLPAGGE